MRSKLPDEFKAVLERLRRQSEIAYDPGGLFDVVLQVVEYVASREDLVRASERELEPDALARKIFSDPEMHGIRAIRSVLAGLTVRDLTKLERILLQLEKQHGKACETLPNHRLLVDGAILGEVGFVYNRKFREILAARTMATDLKPPGLLPALVSRVDALFVNGRPRYLWRLGPEFGVDRNIRHLVDRGDDFIVRSLYRSRARRLARGVLRWEELPSGEWIGENCDDLRYRKLIRSLVVRSSNGRRTEFAVLATNLANTSWEEIYRFYRNRSGKLASRVVLGSARARGRRRALTASILVMALLTFRNARTWADIPDVRTREVAIHRDEITIRVEPSVGLFETNRQAELLDRMQEVANYVQALTGHRKELEGLEVSFKPLSYRIRLPQQREIPVLASGQVVFVDLEGVGDLGKTVVVYHGGGFTSVYGDLASISRGLRQGTLVSESTVIGQAGDGGSPALYLQARIARSYAERGVEPTVATILSSGENLVLDPIGAIVESVGRRAAEDDWGQPRAADRAPRMPSFEDADLYLFQDSYLSPGVLFIEAQSHRAFKPLDEDPFALAFNEDLEDLS